MAAMKSVAILTTMAAAVGAQQSLRGDWEQGVEEVGEQIEFFPNEMEYGMEAPDRRILLAEEQNNNNSVEESMMAERMMEEYFEDFEVTHTIEDAGDYEVEPTYVEEDEADYPDIVGTIIEDENDDGTYYWDEDEEPVVKEPYTPEEGVITLSDHVNLLGEEIEEFDQYHREEAGSCGDNKSEIRIFLKTDNYGYETSWALRNQQGKVVAKGPPQGTNYADKTSYSGKWCVNPGQYRAVINDRGRDGMCTGNPNIYGCGYFKVYLDGKIAGQVTNDKTRWPQKQIGMNAAPISARIDGTATTNNNSGNWCNKVRSVMKVPQGTCTLPNGQRGHRVRVTTKVDKYGMETSWTIRNANGQIKMKMGPVIAANGQKAVEDCLPAGKHNIIFNDLDGVCCKHGQGFWKVHVDGEELMSGGSFIRQDKRDFHLGYDWINTMNERDCEWWFAHDYRRRDWHTRCYSGQYCNKSYRHLKWNPNLKASAKVYANQLLNTCGQSGIKHDETEEGENLAKNLGSGAWGALYPAEKVTNRFVDHEEFWGWNRNAHLTQAMWYPTRYMGCADSVKDMGNGKMCRFQVCRYARAGNCLMGKFNAGTGNNWMKAMMSDDSPCGPDCPKNGCHR